MAENEATNGVMKSTRCPDFTLCLVTNITEYSKNCLGLSAVECLAL